VTSGVARNLIVGVYVLTSHCNFKTCVNVPHVNKTVTDFDIPIYPRRYAPDGDQPAAQRLHRNMIPIFPCSSRRSKGVPSGNGVFLRLLVGELGTPNFPKFSPIANGYTHTECYYTARQIWTKDV